MNRKIRVVQYGVGKASLYTMKYALEKGCEIVGAVDINPELIGKDLSIILGGNPMNVTVTAVTDAEKMLKETKPDICIVTTMDLMNDVYQSLELCAKLGINAITTCGEAFFPMNSNPVSTKAINAIAKETGCTITGSGEQDIYWGELVSMLAASTQRITRIKGSSKYNVNDFGIALAQNHGIGLTLEEFDEKIVKPGILTDDERKEKIDNCEFAPFYMWNVNGWIAEKLGLTIVSQTQKSVPLTSNEDVNSIALGIVIPKGNVTGMNAIVTATTKEGITIETESIGVIYGNEDYDTNEWTVYGEPDTTLVVEKPNNVELSCATVINRIPDIINAEPGYLTTDKIGEPTFKIKPLNEYVNKVE